MVAPMPKGPSVDLKKTQIDVLSVPINQMQVEFLKTPADCKSRSEIDRYTRMILPDGRRLKVTPRFWNSWCSLEGQSKSVFDLFSHAEVFDRLRDKRNRVARIAVEMNPRQDTSKPGALIDGDLLGCTNPNKPILRIEQADDMIFRFDGAHVKYDQGVATAMFECPFPIPYVIAGEDYRSQFCMQMPVDGYGMPTSYLALLRLICVNGAIGMTKAFKTSFQLGKGEKNIAEVLNRAFTTFSAEEGFSSFKQRMEMSAKSWASLAEASRLYKAMGLSLHDDKQPVGRRVEIIEEFDKLCGDPLKLYGLTNREEVSSRRARTIPVKATMYQLITFATELATHEIQAPPARNRLNAWVGDSVASEMDLESSCEEYPDWKDFFVREKKPTVQAMVSA